MAVRVVVRLFAALREQAGAREREVELADGASVADVWPALGLGAEPAGLVYAVNRAYVDRASRVAASAEFVDLGRLGHYMLARPDRWNRFAVESTLRVLDAR